MLENGSKTGANKYKKKVMLEGGGIIELIKEVGRFKKGKGSQPETSSVKKIYQLDNVPISTEKLSQLHSSKGKALHIEKKREEIVKIFSNSGLTELNVGPLLDEWNRPKKGFSVLTGKASFQALEKLGLKNHVLEK